MSSSWSKTLAQITRTSDSNSSLSQTRFSSSDSRLKNRFDSPRPGLGRGRGNAGRHRNSNPPEDTEVFNELKVSESPEDIPVNSGGENLRSQSLGSQFNNRFNSARPGLGRNSNAPEITQKLDELKVSEKSSTSLDFDSEDIPVNSSGENVPSPVNTFAEIDLGRALNENIKRVGFVNPTPIQRHAIPVVIAGRDLMACAQTGSGKTAAFCFPIISGISRSREGVSEEFGIRLASPVALILSPTRELTCQIHDEAKKFAHQTGVKIVVAYGGAPISQQLRIMERGVDILVATPGRLVDMMERERVSLSKLKYLTLDEADRMLDMGFEPQIRNIVQGFDMPKTGARQTMLFSATFPNEIQRLASDFLSNYVFLSVGRVGSSTDRIAQQVEYVEEMDKRNVLLDIIRSQKENGTHGKHALMLIFVETKKKADVLEHWLFRNGFPATAIHGDKVQYEREMALRSFRSGETPILVATDVAARGLDISHVSHVINFDLPKSIDDYVHRIGRTGRAGKSGYATAFFNQNNAPLAKSLVELMQEAKQDVPDWLNRYISNSSSYHGGNGKSNQYSGGGKFGGQDYRSSYSSAASAPRRYEPDGNFGGHDYTGNYSSTSHQYESNGNFGGHGCRGNDSSTPHGYENDGDYGAGSGEYAVTVGSLEPTGWD